MTLFLRLSVLLLALVSAPTHAEVTELLLYCGITMVRPISEIAQNFEKAEHVKVRI